MPTCIASAIVGPRRTLSNSLLEATPRVRRIRSASRPATKSRQRLSRRRSRARLRAVGGISFRGFIEELETQAEKAESHRAPVLEEDAEGVRLMTVHCAKGLEFPIVILADMTANIAAGDPDRFVDARAGFAPRGCCAAHRGNCATTKPKNVCASVPKAFA